MYVLAPNGTVAEYPYSVSQLRADNPNVSFPVPTPDDLLAAYNVFPVEPSEPLYDPITQGITEISPIFVDGKWVQQWEVNDLTAEQVNQNIQARADYFTFWDALLVSSVYQSIRQQAITTPAVLVACTEFVAAISDAKAGRANVAAIQACINNLMSAGTFTTEELSELTNLLVAGKLDSIYTLIT